MAHLSYGSLSIRYGLSGPDAGPPYMLVSGLTQSARLWGDCRNALVTQHFRGVTFDLLESGELDRPRLFICHDDHVALAWYAGTTGLPRISGSLASSETEN
jgi:pimeloyl-ACP methyl ester carboxylesterase